MSEAVGPFASSLEGQRCRVEEFLEREVTPQARKRFGALFERTANYGPIQNDTQFKHIQEWDLWEFKAQQYRILCFRVDERRDIFLTNGFKEEKNRISKSELERANRMRGDYFNSLEAHNAQS